MILSLLLTILTSYFLSAFAGCFLYFFIIFLGLIILNIELLSLFKAISPIGIILLNLIFFIISLILWLKNKKPVLKPDVTELKSRAERILNCFKLDKGLAILGAGFIFLIVISFILCAFLPVNEPDALSYHTYRALIWAQKGFIHHFDTADIRNHVMPINSELIYTWIFSLTNKDFSFGFLQFSSYFFGIAGIWTFLEKFKISYRKRLWAIFIFSSFAGIIAQISSTQTDLLTGVLLFYSVLFFIDYVKQDNIIKGYFSSLSFAIALGVKSTAFMAGLPLLAAYFIYLIFKKKTAGIKKFIKFICFLIINFIIFSSYNYILNLIDYSNPLGSEISINGHGFFGGFKGFLANFVTYNIQLIDFSGFTWGIYLTPLMYKVQSALFALLQIPQETGAYMKLESLNSSLSEQTMGFGITSVLTFLPTAIFSIVILIKNLCIKKIKENQIILLSLGVLFYVNLIVLSFAIGYMTYSIRFITTFIAISTPVLIFTYFKKNNFYKTLVVIFAMFYFFVASGHLAARPFYSLLNAYKKEKSFDNFIYNTRCMNYKFFKGDRPGCSVDENIFSHIEEYKTVGFFSGEGVLMQLAKLNAAKKHIKTDELILSRLNADIVKKYDYIITPYPNQDINVFNNKDKQALLEKKYPKNCYFEKSEQNNKVVLIQCGIPYKKLENTGFTPIYNIRTSYKDIDNKTQYLQYIIWKNTANLSFSTKEK